MKATLTLALGVMACVDRRVEERGTGLVQRHVTRDGWGSKHGTRRTSPIRPSASIGE